MNDYLISMVITVLIYACMFLAMGHEKDITAECIKSTSKQCYTVDEIYKLCTGITK